MRIVAAALFAPAMLTCGSNRVAAEMVVPCFMVESIGVATMSKDGVITLRIRSLPPGPIAEAEFRYAPGDAKYEDIKRHLDGIAPGESKPVRPWC